MVALVPKCRLIRRRYAAPDKRSETRGPDKIVF
jgi:hypothetical protein